jgi:hypothetical protein
MKAAAKGKRYVFADFLLLYTKRYLISFESHLSPHFPILQACRSFTARCIVKWIDFESSSCSLAFLHPCTALHRPTSTVLFFQAIPYRSPLLIPCSYLRRTARGIRRVHRRTSWACGSVRLAQLATDTARVRSPSTTSRAAH